MPDSYSRRLPPPVYTTYSGLWFTTQMLLWFCHFPPKNSPSLSSATEWSLRCTNGLIAISTNFAFCIVFTLGVLHVNSPVLLNWPHQYRNWSLNMTSVIPLMFLDTPSPAHLSMPHGVPLTTFTPSCHEASLITCRAYHLDHLVVTKEGLPCLNSVC